MKNTWPIPAHRALAGAVTFLLIAAIELAGCVPVARPVVKIGLVAPFEGRYRDVGYEVIYAVRLAVREANASGGIAGYSVELTALDDSGDPAAAAEQARKLATDPQVVGVVGDWLEATTQTAAPVYDTDGLPFLATAAGSLPPRAFRLWLTAAAIQAASAGGRLCPLPCESLDNVDWLTKARLSASDAPLYGPPLWGQPQFATLAGHLANGVRFVSPAPYPADSTDPAFAARYRAISSGVEPRANAVLAYDAARLLLAAVAHSAQSGAPPTRFGVSSALERISIQGLSGPIHFDALHNWAEAKAWVYQWDDAQVRRL